MIRKFIIAAAAVAAVSAGALATSTTSAEAGWKGKHKHFHGIHLKHWHGGLGYWGPRFVSYDGCIRHRWVVNRFGETVLRRVNVCY